MDVGLLRSNLYFFLVCFSSKPQVPLLGPLHRERCCGSASLLSDFTSVVRYLVLCQAWNCSHVMVAMVTPQASYETCFFRWALVTVVFVSVFLSDLFVLFFVGEVGQQEWLVLQAQVMCTTCRLLTQRCLVFAAVLLFLLCRDSSALVMYDR